MIDNTNFVFYYIEIKNASYPVIKIDYCSYIFVIAYKELLQAEK